VYFNSIGVLPMKRYEPIDCNHPTPMGAEGSATEAGKIASEAFCRVYANLPELDIVQQGLRRPTDFSRRTRSS
jgi:hypothetical protein